MGLKIFFYRMFYGFAFGYISHDVKRPNKSNSPRLFNSSFEDTIKLKKIYTCWKTIRLPCRPLEKRRRKIVSTCRRYVNDIGVERCIYRVYACGGKEIILGFAIASIERPKLKLEGIICMPRTPIWFAC